MNTKKRITAVISALAVAVSVFSCSGKPLPDSAVTSEADVRLPDFEKVEDGEFFSVLSVDRTAGELTADGKSSGNRYGDFILHDDGTVTVMVEGKELSFDEASEKTGCYLSENSDGTVKIVSPFQKSGVVVKAEGDFDTCGAESVTETVRNHYLLTFSSPAEAYSAYLKLSEDENIEYAEPNQVIVTAETEDDTENGEECYISSWGTEATGVREFCSRLNEEKDELPEIKVAVIDTGIYKDHNVFKNRILDGGRNFSESSSKTGNNENNLDDYVGHGSHCAGIICSSTNDNVKILPVKVFNSAGIGDSYSIYCGMMYSIEYGADVLSMSLGGEGYSTLMEEAVKEAAEKDITVCVAAGNESSELNDRIECLTDLDECVVVSSLDSNLKISDYSNYQKIDFAAPGRGILSVSTENPDASILMSGTSMATPFAAACFANILSYDNTLSSDEVYNLLKANTADLYEPGYDDKTGWGMLYLRDFVFSTDIQSHPSLSELKKTESFESDKIIIRSGVLESYTADNNESADLKKMVEDGVVPEFNEVGYEAFAYTGIKEVVLPDSVTKINSAAFIGCSKLERVVTDAEEICDYAFSYCTSLKTIEGNNISEIGSSFTGCCSLIDVDFTKVTKIPSAAFFGCKSIKSESFSFPAISEFGSECFSGSGISGKVSLDSVEQIGSGAFKSTSVEEIILPDTVKELPENVFYGCMSLRKISAPSVIRICKGALALMKTGYSEQNKVVTDIDFSKILYVEQPGAFIGYVFNGPVSFDSLVSPELSCFDGAYGESLSLPGYRKADDYGYTSCSLYFNTLILRNAVTADFEGVAFRGTIVTGDCLKKINGFSESENVCFYTENDNSEVLNVFEESGVNYRKTSEIWIPEFPEEINQFEQFCYFAWGPGKNFKYSYTVKNTETGRIVSSAENSENPLIPETAFPGEYECSIDIAPDGEDSVLSKTFSFSVTDCSCGELTENSCVSEIATVMYGDRLSRNYSFKPERNAQYFLYSVFEFTEIYGSDGSYQWLTKGENILNLKKDTEYVFRVQNYSDSFSNYLYFNIYIGIFSMDNNENSLKNIEDCFIDSAEYNPENEDEILLTITDSDGEILDAEKDYKIIEYNRYSKNILIAGVGRYYGLMEYYCEIYRKAGVNEWITTDEPVKFTPEKSGYYTAVFVPDSEKLDDALNKGYFLNDTCMGLNVKKSYSGIWGDYDNYEQTGQSEIKAYLEEGETYYFECSKSYYQKCIITDKTTVSQCEFSCPLDYEYNGEAVIPEIEISDNGRKLVENTDYKVTFINNQSPGIMYALTEGCGDYSGYRLTAMTIEGAGVKASEYNGKTVIDISQDEPFLLAGCLTYRITFDHDTLISSDWIPRKYTAIFDRVDKKVATVRGIYLKRTDNSLMLEKGTYLISFFNSKDEDYSGASKSNGVQESECRNIAGAEITLKYSRDADPLITVNYEGSLLTEGKDYSVYKSTDEKETLKTITVKGEGDYAGEKELLCSESFRLPDNFKELKDGISTVNLSDNNCYVWVPEKSDYRIASLWYLYTDIVITDEDGVQVLCGSLNKSTDADFTVEPGKKYYLYISGKFNDDFSLVLKTEGRLSDCDIEYNKVSEVSDEKVLPEVAFRDGDYILQYGIDYEAVTEGRAGVTGRIEYVYRGLGSYYGEVKIPVTKYMNKLTDTDDFEKAKEGEYFAFPAAEFLSGNTVRMKVTSEKRGCTRYSLKMKGEIEEELDYISVFMYDSEGYFMKSGEEAMDFCLMEGQTVYLLVTAPVYCDDEFVENIWKNEFFIESEKSEISVSPNSVPGDVNCDGTVNVFDLMKLKRYLTGSADLYEQSRLNAMLCENEKNPTVKDLMIISKMILAA